MENTPQSNNLPNIERAINDLTRATLGLVPVSWQTATLQNGWGNYGGGFNSFGFYIDKFGIVHLRGLINGGTSTVGTLLATLPSGYRPPNTIALATSGNSSYSEIRIASDGTIKNQIAGAGFLCMDGLSFPTF